MESAEVFFGQATHVYRPRRWGAATSSQSRSVACL